MTVFYVIYSILIPLIVFILPKYILTNKVQKGVEGQVGLSGYLMNWIPFYNTFKTKKVIEGRSPFFLFLSFYALLTTVLLIPARFVLFNDVTVQLAMTMWVIVFLVIAYLSEIVFLVYMCKMFDRRRAMIFVFIPFFCAALIIPHIEPYFKRYKDEIEGTFTIGE